jgi:hypothetical protein
MGFLKDHYTAVGAVEVREDQSKLFWEAPAACVFSQSYAD